MRSLFKNSSVRTPVRTLVRTLAITATLSLSGPLVASAQEKLVIATTGGTWEKEMRTHFFDPFTKETGIQVITVSGTGAENVARIKAMAQTGHVEWDLYQAGEIQAVSELHKTLNEDMTEFCRAYQADKDLLPGACASSGVLSAYGTTLLAYNTKSFPGKGLKTWADFFDVEKFPGPRSMPNFNDPWRVMAAALLADGVQPEKLFPLDVDRALVKLDKIRPHIALWWKTGDQSTQGFRTGEYVVGEIWQTRASALKKEGQPLGWSQDQAFLVGDRWALIRKAPHRANAIKFLEYFLAHAQAQARVCEALTCTPARYSAAHAMDADAQAASPTSPEVFEKLIRPDAAWINANTQMLLERWNEWNQR